MIGGNNGATGLVRTVIDVRSGPKVVSSGADTFGQDSDIGVVAPKGLVGTHMRFLEGEQELPKARDEGLLVERVDHELVIYDEVGKVAHCLSQDVASVWEVCDGQASEADIATRLGLAPSTVAQAVSELRESGLLDGASGYSRREAAKRMAAVGGAALAAPALMYSMPVPAAAAACSKHIATCVTSEGGGYSDWNALPSASDSIWFNSRITGNLTGVDTSTVILVTGTITPPVGTAPPPGTLSQIPTRITFTNAAGAVTLTYMAPALNNPFGSGTLFADEVIPLSCIGAGEIFMAGLMWLPGTTVNPPGSKGWFWQMSLTILGTPPSGNLGWNFGAAGYSNQPDYTGSASDYNNLEINTAQSGTCGLSGSLHGGAPTNPAIQADNVAGGSGGGGSNYTGSNSAAEMCTTPACA